LRPISEPESTRKSFGKGVKVAPVIHSVDLEEDEVVVPPPATEPVDIDLPEVDYVDDDIEEYIETEVDLNDIQDGDVILDETPTTPVTPSAPIVDKESLEDALAKLTALRNRWVDFKSAKASSD
jgi:hypothetical protein